MILGLVDDRKELDLLREYGLKINDFLVKFFGEAGMTLVDFKVEFGKDANGKIILADEITPDSCRLWDKKTGKKMDKDIFRQDLGDLMSAYKEVLERIAK